MPLANVFFQDFLWIGIAMLLVLGIPNTVATVLLVRKSASQYRATLATGILLLLWTGFELIFMPNGLAIGYFVVGIVVVAASVLLGRTTVQRSAE
jgi:hypothetical protein